MLKSCSDHQIVQRDLKKWNQSANGWRKNRSKVIPPTTTNMLCRHYWIMVSQQTREQEFTWFFRTFPGKKKWNQKKQLFRNCASLHLLANSSYKWIVHRLPPSLSSCGMIPCDAAYSSSPFTKSASCPGPVNVRNTSDVKLLNWFSNHGNGNLSTITHTHKS